MRTKNTTSKAQAEALFWQCFRGPRFPPTTEQILAEEKIDTVGY